MVCLDTELAKVKSYIYSLLCAVKYIIHLGASGMRADFISPHFVSSGELIHKSLLPMFQVSPASLSEHRLFVRPG